jgi:hypothetical protein
VFVFGGEHADVPLEPTAGAVLADFMIEQRLPAILDLKLMRKGEKRRFMIQFAETLFHKNREPLMVMIDETPIFAPQIFRGTDDDSARCLGAVEDLATLAGSRGVGVTLIAQRPSLVNTTLRTQVENLIVLRTIGKHDRKAIDEWVEAKGSKEERDLMMADLASLPNGTGYFWSPGWMGEFRKVPFRMRETFDSSKTPKVGEKVIQPRVLAQIDKQKLSAEILATAEKVKANDPAELKKEITALRKQLAGKPTGTPADTAELAALRKEVAQLRKPRPIPQEALQAAAIDARKKLATKLIHRLTGMKGVVEAMAQDLSQAADATVPVVEVSLARAAVAGHTASVNSPVIQKRVAIAEPGGEDRKLERAERALLGVLAQFPEGRTKIQLSIQSGYSIKSSSFANAIGALRSSGLAHGSGTPTHPLVITEAGQAVAGNVEPMPTDAETLLQHWRGVLEKAERFMLDALATADGLPLTKEQLSERTGYSITSSSFANAIGRLRSLQLIQGSKEFTLAEDLRA